MNSCEQNYETLENCDLLSDYQYKMNIQVTVARMAVSQVTKRLIKKCNVRILQRSKEIALSDVKSAASE